MPVWAIQAIAQDLPGVVFNLVTLVQSVGDFLIHDRERSGQAHRDAAARRGDLERFARPELNENQPQILFMPLASGTRDCRLQWQDGEKLLRGLRMGHHDVLLRYITWCRNLHDMGPLCQLQLAPEFHLPINADRRVGRRRPKLKDAEAGC